MHLNNKFKFENKNGLMLVFFTAIISGFSIFINSIGVKEFESSIFTFLKNAVVAAFLLGIILGFGNFSELRKLTKKQWLQLLIIGLIGGSIPFLLFFQGLKMTTGTTSGFIHKTIFIFVAIFAIIFLKEKPTKVLMIGTTLLLLGNYFLIKPNFKFTKWHLLILAAVIFWAAENTYAKYVLKDLSGTIVAFGRMFFGSIFILIFLILTGKISRLTELSTTQIEWVLLTSVLLLLFVFTYYNGLKQIKATTAASVLAIGSPITTLLGWLFSGKTLSLHESIGIFLTISGIVTIIWLSTITKYIGDVLSVKEHGRN